MMAVEYGLPPVDERPVRAAAVIFGAFILAGMFPLLPYLIGLADPFLWSIGIAACTFFAIGTIKSRWSLAPWWQSGIETLLIGGVAAALAYAVGVMVHP